MRHVNNTVFRLDLGSTLKYGEVYYTRQYMKFSQLLKCTPHEP